MCAREIVSERERWCVSVRDLDLARVPRVGYGFHEQVKALLVLLQSSKRVSERHERKSDRERERERYMYICLSIHLSIYLHI